MPKLDSMRLSKMAHRHIRISHAARKLGMDHMPRLANVRVSRMAHRQILHHAANSPTGLESMCEFVTFLDDDYQDCGPTVLGEHQAEPIRRVPDKAVRLIGPYALHCGDYYDLLLSHGFVAFIRLSEENLRLLVVSVDRIPGAINWFN